MNFGIMFLMEIIIILFKHINNFIILVFNNFHCVFFFYFLLPINRESTVFGSNFRNGGFDGFTRYEDP